MFRLAYVRFHKTEKKTRPTEHSLQNDTAIEGDSSITFGERRQKPQTKKKGKSTAILSYASFRTHKKSNT